MNKVNNTRHFYFKSECFKSMVNSRKSGFQSLLYPILPSVGMTLVFDAYGTGNMELLVDYVGENIKIR